MRIGLCDAERKEDLDLSGVSTYEITSALLAYGH
jgi:hypothetical protein